ncbi:MAG: hypothetical protein IPJ18_22680 [Betaproteobacteria bacterium]|nr:hypothetical protein [Betaproteobacteria bacterium]
MQLPLGKSAGLVWSRKVILAFLSAAVLGCVAFAIATSFSGLLAARVLGGAGCQCSLDGTTRRVTGAGRQQGFRCVCQLPGCYDDRLLGMLASTLSVEWLMPVVDAGVAFGDWAVMVVLKQGRHCAESTDVDEPGSAVDAYAGPKLGYADICCHPYFRKVLPSWFFIYVAAWLPCKPVGGAWDAVEGGGIQQLFCGRHRPLLD